VIGRRAFLGAACAGLGSAFAAPYQRAAANLQKKVKITGVKCMIVRGTWDWNLIKIETDSGLYGIGEAYWGWGVKDMVLNKLAPIIVGEDPLNVDKLYTKMLMQSAGAGAIAGRRRGLGPRVFHLDDDVIGGGLVGFGGFAAFAALERLGLGLAGGSDLVERGEVDRVVLFLLEHDVRLERLHHLGLQFEHGQLQQLDGLLQLRGHRKLLPELELQGRLEHGSLVCRAPPGARRGQSKAEVLTQVDLTHLRIGKNLLRRSGCDHTSGVHDVRSAANA